MDITKIPFATIVFHLVLYLNLYVARPDPVVEATAVSVVNENAIISEPAPPELLPPCPKPASSFVVYLQHASKDDLGDGSNIPASDGSYSMVVFSGAIFLFRKLNTVINHTPRRGN